MRVARLLSWMGFFAPEGGDAGPAGGAPAGEKAPAEKAATPTVSTEDGAEDLRTKLESSRAKGRAELEQQHRAQVAALEQRVAGAEKDSATTKEELGKLQKHVADRDAAEKQAAADAAFERAAGKDGAKIKPAYIKLAQTELGAIDPTTEAGKKAIDDWAARHPEVIEGAEAKPPSPDAALAAFHAAKVKAAPGAAWSFLPPGSLADIKVE